MGMLEAYNGNVLQELMALLNRFEMEGVTDIRFVRIRAADELHRRLIEGRKKAQARVVKRCPDCGTVMVPMSIDGVGINACKSCRYSEVAR